MITLTRAQLIQRQKDLGAYCPELHPPVNSPSPLAGSISIAQTYWLQNVLEEMEEFMSCSLEEEPEEIADVLIFLQALHFSITDEPFVLDPQVFVRLDSNCSYSLRKLAAKRKTWKTYPAVSYTCADWFMSYHYSPDTWPKVTQAYYAKLERNKSRADWNLRQEVFS